MTKVSPNTIWQVPAYLPYVQPRLTGEMIADAERKIGHQLPSSYLDLLRVQNGGYIRFTLPESLNEQLYGIGPHFPSLTKYDWAECREYVSYELDGLVPFDGDGHWYLCLDYREHSGSPRVSYVDVECDHQEVVAESFDAYLSMLRIQVRDECVLETGETIELVLAKLATALGGKWSGPSSFDYGYPEYRCQVKAEWLSAGLNRSPRGFVRENDPHYMELKYAMPGEAARYPELSLDAVIVYPSSGIKEEFLNACGKLDLTVRPLRDFFAPSILVPPRQ